MAVLDVGTVMASVKTLISTLTTWQALTGAADATAALAFIHSWAVDDSGETPAPLILLDIEDIPLEFSGSRFQGRATVTMRIELPIPEANQVPRAAQAEYFWLKQSAILAEMRAGVRGSGQLMMEGIRQMVRPGAIDPKENQNRVEWNSQLGLEIYLI